MALLFASVIFFVYLCGRKGYDNKNIYANRRKTSTQ